MVALTITDAIQGLSYYTVGVAGDITSTQLGILQQLIAGDLSRRNPGFTGDDLTRFEAYLVLDAYENKAGTGVRTQEKIKDNAYTIRAPTTSSYWMDCACRMISEYKVSSDDSSDYAGVVRDDTDMTIYSDGSNDPYIDPYDPFDLDNSQS